MGRRIVPIVLAALLASPSAFAQPSEPEPDIEMDPQDAAPAPTPAPNPAPTPPADGQPIAKDPKVAKKWQSAAQQLVQKGDYLSRKNKPDDAKPMYDNAVTAYEHAIEASEDVGLHYDLGLVFEKLGKLDLAAGEMRTVTSAKAGVKPDVLKKATAKFDELSTKVGIVTLTVNTENATITLNGVELGKSPLPQPLIFMPGTYTLAFTADGFQPKDSEIKVEAGSESERSIELDPVKITVEPIRPDTSEPVAQTKPTGPSKMPLYVGAGLTGALAVTGIVTGILAVSQHGTFVGAKTSPLDREDAQSNGKTLAHVTDAVFAGALVAGGFTAYWYFYKYKKALKKQGEPDNPIRRDPNAPDITKVDVVPWVQPTGGGFSVAGSF